MVRCRICDARNPPGRGRCIECGAELPEEPAGAPGPAPASDDDLLRLVEGGQKIEAIKRYRERTGVGLREAKDAIDAIEQGRQPPRLPERPQGRVPESELIGLLEQRKKIQAIKLYRERTGVGLAEAKRDVEAIAARHGLATSGGVGCAGVVAAMPLAGWLLWRMVA